MPNVWRLIAHHENAAEVVDYIRRTGQIYIGWGEIGDLQQNPYHSVREITQAIRQHYPTLNNAHLGGPSLWRFAYEMQPHDLVILSTKKGPALSVEVTDHYDWDRDDDTPPLTGNYFHHRAVHVTDLNANILLRQAGGMAAGENVRWTLFRCANPVTP